MAIHIKELGKHDLHKIAEIDTSEKVEYNYVYRGGKLEKVRVDYDVPTWTAETIEKNINMRIPKLESDGHFLGAFDNEQLVN